MIVVFVVDTSPSMSRPISSDSSSGTTLTRLDVAKMVVEDLSRRLRKGVAEHVRILNHQVEPAVARSLSNMGQGPVHTDALLLLSTSKQYPETASCAAGGRLLVGFGTDDIPVEVSVVGPTRRNAKIG
jgi:hypothetical protein